MGGAVDEPVKQGHDDRRLKPVPGNIADKKRLGAIGHFEDEGFVRVGSLSRNIAGFEIRTQQ